MAFAAFEVSLEEAKPVFQFSWGCGVCQDQLSEFGVETLVAGVIVHYEGQEWVLPVGKWVPVDIRQGSAVVSFIIVVRGAAAAARRAARRTGWASGGRAASWAACCGLSAELGRETCPVECCVSGEHWRWSGSTKTVSVSAHAVMFGLGVEGWLVDVGGFVLRGELGI